MKHVAILSVVAALAGCAGMPGQAEPPHYDHGARALISPSYPLERIATPAGFRLFNTAEAAHDDATEAIVAWVSDEGDAAVASAWHQAALGGRHWLAWDESQGYEFVGSHRAQYAHETGRFRDMVGEEIVIPRGAPECAASSTLLLHTNDRAKRTILSYTEGVPCDRAVMWGRQDAEAQRERAYQAFGLR